MIIVTLLGMDTYQAIDETRKLHSALVKAYGCKDDELEFFAPEGFIIHDGVEQTSFRLNITVDAPKSYSIKEKEIKDLLFFSLKDAAVHFRVVFRYFDPANEYVRLDDTYPTYMTDSNTVKSEKDHTDEVNKEADKNFEEEAEEPYMGDIIGEFDKYIKDHPDATDKEVYDTLMGIRTEVTEKHHQEEAKNKK